MLDFPLFPKSRVPASSHAAMVALWLLHFTFFGHSLATGFHCLSLLRPLSPTAATRFPSPSSFYVPLASATLSFHTPHCLSFHLQSIPSCHQQVTVECARATTLHLTLGLVLITRWSSSSKILSKVCFPGPPTPTVINTNCHPGQISQEVDCWALGSVWRSWLGRMRLSTLVRERRGREKLV